MIFGFGRKKQPPQAPATPAVADLTAVPDVPAVPDAPAVPNTPAVFEATQAPPKAVPEQAQPLAAPDDELPASPTPPEPEPEKKGWFARLKAGLSRTSSRLTEGIAGIFTKRKLDHDTLEELEELLIAADLGPATAAALTQALSKTRFGKEISEHEVRHFLAGEIAALLTPVAQPLRIIASGRPHIILMVGVNGTGKTTTIGKLAQQWRAEGLQVMLCAGDTFRAAAVEQLKIWGQRTGCVVVAGTEGADAAGLAYTALEQARAAQADILLIDTAGRLHNKKGLMDELKKIVRVLKKLDPNAPHSTLLTLDATTGQNAVSQVGTFKDMVDVNGLVVTKLDGSAKGGVLVALADKFALPVHYIGVGETAADLRPFSAQDFANSLMGLADDNGK
jgi:fused signal recognition particle receptor